MVHAIVSFRDVRLTRAGRTWKASYFVDEDGRLVIRSAWGSRATRDPGLSERVRTAQDLLAHLVDENG